MTRKRCQLCQLRYIVPTFLRVTAARARARFNIGARDSNLRRGGNDAAIDLFIFYD